MRSFLILCLCVLPLAAEEPIESALGRLRSEDPVARSEARERLLRGTVADAPVIRGFALAEPDAEARAAAREIAEILEYRSRREVLMKASFAAFEGEIGALEKKGPKVISILGDVLRYSRVLVVEDLYAMATQYSEDSGLGFVGIGETESSGKEPVEVLKCRASCALAALTLADFGRNVEAWLDFIAKHEGVGWQNIRMDGLESRGFRVRSENPIEAASELLRAWSGQIRAFPPGRSDDVASCTEAGIRSLEDLLRGLLEDVPENGPGGLDGFHCAEFWLRLNRSDFEWREGRLHSRASPGDYAERLTDGDPLVRIAALWVLDAHGWEIPAAGWNVIRDAPEFALRVMSPTGHAVPPDCIPYYFEATAGVPAFLLEPAPPLDSQALTTLIEDPDTELIVRCRILRWLLLRADRARFSLNAADAGGGEDIPYPCTRSRHAGWETPESPGALPVFVDACLGDEADLDRAERWLSAAGPHEVFLEIAAALARRGRRQGLLVIGVRASIGLPFEFRSVVRSLVEGAPPGDDAAEWQAWGSLDSDKYEWDPVQQRWTPQP